MRQRGGSLTRESIRAAGIATEEVSMDAAAEEAKQEREWAIQHQEEQQQIEAMGQQEGDLIMGVGITIALESDEKAEERAYRWLDREQSLIIDSFSVSLSPHLKW